ncbi:beta-glucosidase family protein [Parasediminibacterium sp. JCM 36343]|uniref:beta-glucosidase n=1 Tax=Parasediminibacterium sp. JCM 36343 TaxID=3374279 RepID=UPI0039789FC1
MNYILITFLQKSTQIKKVNLLAFSFFLLANSTGFCQKNTAIEHKIDSLLHLMTLEEKVTMIHAASGFTTGAVPRLGIPELVMSDGPHGVRPELGRYWVKEKEIADSGTYLPTGICLAATWNPRLGIEFGKVLGSEAAYRGKDMILGPGINIIRSPLNGRNFEYASEDPFLVSKMAVGYIKGVQSQGISACVKHYLANNQETLREYINVEMSERALREIYLPGFKAAVQEGHVNAVMGAYNLFRGQHAAHNDYTINKILKGEWGFDGVLVSDWNGVHDTKEALQNGTDIEMGTEFSKRKTYNNFYMADSAVAAVRNGVVKESVIDDKVRRILRIMYRTNVLDGKRKKGEYNTKAHQQTALKVAEEGIVLLKNENKLLPINASTTKTIAVIGTNATRLQAMGGGSSQVKAFYEVTPLQGLKNIAGNKANIKFAEGFRVEEKPVPHPELIAEAAALAAKSDVAIIIGGWIHNVDYPNFRHVPSFDSEEKDKLDIDMLYGQNELIQAVLKANPKTIVVLMGGGTIDITKWVDKVPAILQSWYPGMEGGNALANIVFGKVNTSGKLPITFPKTLADAPAHKLGEFPGDGKNVVYKDDIFVGYRYFDTYNVKPQFAFGHGLSYTNFLYSNLAVTKEGGKYIASFAISNTGKVAGSEVAQLYIHAQKTDIKRAEKELRGFEKIALLPGETKKVSITLGKEAFQYFNETKNAWDIEPGTYEILVGGASDDIKLKKAVELDKW